MRFDKKLSGFHYTWHFSFKEKAFLMFFPLFILCLFFFPLTVNANTDSLQPVRIGYYENEVFEEGASPGAAKTGYAYEYYRKLSEYTGWNYEYVYGSFGNLYDILGERISKSLIKMEMEE